MDFVISFGALFFALSALLIGIRLSAPRARRKRFEAPRVATLEDMVEVPMWSSTRTTVRAETPVGQEVQAEEAPTPSAPPAAVTEIHNQVNTLLQEMNRHLNAARFDDAMRVANQVSQLASTLPPDQRNITIRHGANTLDFRSTTTVVTTTQKPADKKPAEDKTVKTRFDLIG